MPKLPRGVSPKKTIALRLPEPLIEALATEETRTGETRTQIIERLLTKGLKMERDTATIVRNQLVNLLRDGADMGGWDMDIVSRIVDRRTGWADFARELYDEEPEIWETEEPEIWETIE